MSGFAAIGLVRPKTPWNVGGVLRAAGCYDVRIVVVSGQRGQLSLANLSADTASAYRHIPTVRVDDVFDAHPVGSIPVAVDLIDGATSLVDFVHPRSAFYIFGPEDGTLGKDITAKCPFKVFVPTTGCMNLAATVNVVLYDRLAKSRLA